MSVKVVVMAAGQGTRMKSELPKVLHEVAGRPLVGWVIEAARKVDPSQIVVVVGHGAEQVTAALPDDVETCIQAEQLGTGHAVQVALDHMGDCTADTVLVLSGDTPLLDGEHLAHLVRQVETTGAALALVTSVVDDPTGYGRVIRDTTGHVLEIVEHKDAVEELVVREINAGIYAFAGDRLTADLAELENHNAQGEYYLTDVISSFARQGLLMFGEVTDFEETAGVNTHIQLAEANRVMRRRLNESWMAQGVWMEQPDHVYLTADVVLAPGVKLYSGVHLEGATAIEAGAQVGPDVFVSDSRIGGGARVWYSVLRGAEVGEEAEVGPFVSLRPGTVMAARTKAGTFVEMKNTQVGEGSKVPHLSYMGDATIGKNSNIGAGTITCNYDGVNKYSTVIGDGVFIGSDTMLVAPLEIGDSAVTGAGSAITRDVPPGALAVERSTQKEISGYAARLEERRRRKREGE